MEQPSDEFDDWLTDQAAHTREYLDELPGRQELLARVERLGQMGPQRSGFAFAGGQMFHLCTRPHEDGPVLVVAEGNAERVLLDVNASAGGSHRHLDWYVPSPDGTRVACAVSSGGRETCTIRILNVADGTELDDTIGNVRFPFLSWLDGNRFVYHRYLDKPAGGPPDQWRLDSRSYVHRLGTDPDDDRVVLARGLNPRISLDPRDRPFAYYQPGTEHVLAIVSHSSLGGDRTDEDLSDCTLYIGSVDSLEEPASAPWVKVAGPTDDVMAFAVGQGKLYVVSRLDAPRGRVLAIPLSELRTYSVTGPTDEPMLANASVMVAQSERIIEAVRIAGDCLLIRDFDGGSSRLRRVPIAGGDPEDVAVPVDGTFLEWSGRVDSADVVLAIEPWTDLPRVYRYDAARGAVVHAGWNTPATVGIGEIETQRMFVPACDGTPIPMTLIYRSGLCQHGDNPTILTGYGSFGAPFTARFRDLSGVLAWVELGGVWAVAHIRGGGEYGQSWHDAGRLHTKENTITDFIDCAEYLVAQGYTRPARLAGSGGSAGGIPTGGALVRRPDLWAAMVLHYPLVNALRAEFSENGPINVSEFGSVHTEDGLRSLLIIDSYHRVHDGTPYPAVLLTVGRNDPRVSPWQPAKMTARLQAATASSSPVLLRVEQDGGHGGIGATTAQRDGLIADELAFLMRQIG
jgi:prolyl oligopeptidase